MFVCQRGRSDFNKGSIPKPYGYKQTFYPLSKFPIPHYLMNLELKPVRCTGTNTQKHSISLEHKARKGQQDTRAEGGKKSFFQSTVMADTNCHVHLFPSNVFHFSLFSNSLAHDTIYQNLPIGLLVWRIFGCSLSCKKRDLLGGAHVVSKLSFNTTINNIVTPCQVNSTPG